MRAEKINKIQQTNESGFSLMEVMVAIYIITFALVGIMTLMGSISASASVSSSRLIAANLAQEGMEVVKSIRDFNYGANSWDDWYNSVAGGSYLVQYGDMNLGERSFDDGLALKYDLNTGLYGYDTGNTTSFLYRRKIILTKISAEEIKVEAVVSWVEHNRAKSLTVENRMWNWR